MSYKDKITDAASLKKLFAAYRKEGKKVVQCHGCFDIIHPGHVRYLEHAKSMGDVLVVSITADKFIMKGDDRPFMPEELRVNSMAALEIVDHVVLDNHSWAGPVLEELQPDVYVKGKEYEHVTDGIFGEERRIVEGYGGKMFFTSGDVVFSSSKIINDFKQQFDLNYEVFKIFCERNEISGGGLKQIIDGFGNKKVVVVGEVLLDEYQFCEVVDVSAEAPILTIRPQAEEQFVGAAGVVARHLAGLGAKTVMCTALGSDPSGQLISEVLKKDGIELINACLPDFSTIRKVRYLGDEHKLLKIEYSRRIAVPGNLESKIISRIKTALDDADCLVFSDFAYGLITENIRSALTNFANEKGIPVVADVSSTLGGNISRYQKTTLITPTEKEARMVFDDKSSGLSNIAFRLFEKTGAKNLVITLGANGLLAFKNKAFKVHGKPENHLENEYIPALEKNARDPMGAGDAMLAILALCMASGVPLGQAVYLGNIASYLEVNRLGNVPNTADDVQKALKNRPELHASE